jgi:hypothetical protein
MTEDEARRLKERQDGNYSTPILKEPVTSLPVPKWEPVGSR